MMDFVRDTRPLSLALVGGRGHYDVVMAALMQARTSVWIATANLKELMVEDHVARPGQRRARPGGSSRNYRSVVAVFDDLVSRGVEIRLLHAAPPSRRFSAELARHPKLRQQGFSLRACPRVHMKLVIVDGAAVYVGSANFTGAGLGAKGQGRRNFELGFWSRDDVLLDETQALYDHVWAGAPCAACGLRAQCPAPLDGRKKGGNLLPLAPASARAARC